MEPTNYNTIQNTVINDKFIDYTGVNDENINNISMKNIVIENNTSNKLNLYSNNNNVKLIEDCEESSDWKLHLVSLANESIEISPNYAGGFAFESMLITLLKNMQSKPNLRVHIVLSDDFLDQSINKLLEKIKIKFTNKFNYLITGKRFQLLPYLGNRENHEKMMVIDGKYVILGGSGIKDEMNTKGDAPPPANVETHSWKDSFVSLAFRDTDVIVEGEIAQNCREHFFELYQSWETIQTGVDQPNRFFQINSQNVCSCDLFDHNPGLVKGVKAKMLFTHPLDPKENPISNKIAKLIRKSQNEVRIAHMNFNPGDEISSALVSTNSHVTLITNGLGDRSPFACRTFVETNRTNYTLVDQVFEFQIPNTLYHKKIMTVDQDHTVIGSYNFSYKSAFLDNEVAIVIKSPELTARVNTLLNRDSQLSKELPQEEKSSLQSSLSNRVWKELQIKSTAHFF